MTSHYSVLFRSPMKNARMSGKKLVKVGRHIHTFRDLTIFFVFLGLDVRVSQEVELGEEGEDGGGRESEAAGTSEDVMRRKQELKLDLGLDYVFLFSLNSLRFALTSETDQKKS